jgi:hypothetical protein
MKVAETGNSDSVTLVLLLVAYDRYVTRESAVP